MQAASVVLYAQAQKRLLAPLFNTALVEQYMGPAAALIGLGSGMLLKRVVQVDGAILLPVAVSLPTSLVLHALPTVVAYTHTPYVALGLATLLYATPYALLATASYTDVAQGVLAVVALLVPHVRFLSSCESVWLATVLATVPIVLRAYLSGLRKTHAVLLALVAASLAIGYASPQCAYSPYPDPLPASLQSFGSPSLATGIIKILNHSESTTGFIAAVDVSTKYGRMRVLRADHSFIGGTYLDEFRSSIFGSFYYMDFIRFIHRDWTPPINLLQIGLGVGISTRTIMENSLDYHIHAIELDPAVYSYATQYFNLPLLNPPHTITIGDGTKYIQNCTKKYNVVLHDVFTGGQVPADLFTNRVFENIKQCMTPDGILAVNFVGSVKSSEGTKAVYATIKSVFEFVQVYSEPVDESSGDDVVRNLVFYASNVDFNFSEPNYSQVQHVSGMYEEMWRKFKKSRVKIDEGGIVLVDSTLLTKFQKGSVERHWELMQEMFPTEFWNAF